MNKNPIVGVCMAAALLGASPSRASTVSQQDIDSPWTFESLVLTRDAGQAGELTMAAAWTDDTADNPSPRVSGATLFTQDDDEMAKNHVGIPLPSTLWLMGGGLTGLTGLVRREPR